MTIDKPTSKWRSFAIWSAVGAIFSLLLVSGMFLFVNEGHLNGFSGKVAAQLGLAVILSGLVIGLSMQSRPVSVRTVSKFAITSAGGGAVAYLGIRMGIQLREAGAFGAMGLSGLVAGTIGLLYVLLATVIGIGLPSPRFGAQFLNVEDADELRDQRRMLGYAVAGLAAMGVPLTLLALAGPGGIVPPSVALLCALVLSVAVVLFGVGQWRHMDELMRSLSQECSAITCYLIMAIGGGWAILAHLGFESAPAPLDWLSMFYGLPLVAAFIASARRGLLKPR